MMAVSGEGQVSNVTFHPTAACRQLQLPCSNQQGQVAAHAPQTFCNATIRVQSGAMQSSSKHPLSSAASGALAEQRAGSSGHQCQASYNGLYHQETVTTIANCLMTISRAL